MKKLLLIAVLFLVQLCFSSTIKRDTLSLQNPIMSVLDIADTPEFNHKFIETHFSEGNGKIKKFIDKGKKIMALINKGKKFVSSLGRDNLVSLPVGVKKVVGNTTIIMGVSEAKFFPEYTQVAVFVRITLPQADLTGNQKQLFFGSENLKISHSGGIVGDANISLLGDVAIPIKGGNSMLLLKGGFDMETGEVEEKTYVTVDCDGFKELGISADVWFPRKLIEPLDENYNRIADPNVKVSGHFETVVSDWNNITAEIELPPFQLTNKGKDTGKAGLVFDVGKAYFDFSDTRNIEGVEFPDIYTQEYLIPGNEELWRGVYIESFTVLLPQAFRKRGSDERMKINASNMIIDSRGVTGDFEAEEILSIDKGDASGWQFSLDYFQASLVTNKLVAGGFGGSIVLPTSKKVDANDVTLLEKPSLKTSSNESEGSLDKENQTTKNKGVIQYTAMIDPLNEDYSLELEALSDLNFDVFKAKLNIDSNSKIELKIEDGVFKPKATLHGNMSINASNKQLSNGKKGLVEFKGVTFQDLVIKTEAPYLTVGHLGYEGDSKLANFPVSIDPGSIQLTSTNNDVAIGFKVNVNLMNSSDKGFSGGTTLKVLGKFDDSQGGIKKWKFKKVKVQQINIEANLGAVKLKGLIDIKDDDPVYGNGFYGKLEADFIDKIKVSASAYFGKKDGFRYWYVDAYADISGMPTKPAIGPILINGFGGGAYYHMKKTTQQEKQIFDGQNPVKTPPPESGSAYVPDVESGLGFRAMIGFELGNEKALNGKVGFEIAFNTSFGLNRVIFFGEAHMIKAIDFKFGDKFKDKLTKMENKINGFADNEQFKKLKKTNLVEFTKLAFPKDGLKFDLGIDAFFSMEMDFENASFHSTMEAYVNSPGDIIRGVQDRGLAGTVVLHIDKDNWSLKLGTPKIFPQDEDKRIGLKMGVGGLSVSAKSYFMMGTDIPGSPPPPQKVADILGVDLDELDSMRDLNALGDGSGIALGMSLDVDTGDMKFLMFYARFAAGLGFDVMLKDYGQTACKGSGQIGMDGWYANGQAYAYLEGELGINVKVFRKRKKIAILKGSAAVLLQAGLPNPTWFRGYVGGSYSVLGGLIKGKYNFKMQIGEMCELTEEKALDGIEIISGITPSKNATDVDVFSIPQVAFNMPIDKPFAYEDIDGVENNYKILLNEFSIKKDGADVVGDLEWNSLNDVVNYKTFEILPSESTLKLKVKISFQEYKNNTWVNMTGTNGQVLVEERIYTFTTGEEPNYIPMDNVVYTYPVVNQKYFFKKESNYGYVKLERSQPNLFSPQTDWKQKIYFISDDEGLTSSDISYEKSNARVKFKIPENLKNSTEYTLKIVSSPPTQERTENETSYTSIDSGDDGTTINVKNKEVQELVNDENETKIISFDFGTSKFDKFSRKMNARNITQHFRLTHENDPDIQAIQLDATRAERFDEVELYGNQYSDSKPLIVPVADLNNPYHRDISELLYDKINISDFSAVGYSDFKFDFSIDKGVDVLSWYFELLSSSPYDTLLDDRIPYMYNLANYYKTDFSKVTTRLADIHTYDQDKYHTLSVKYGSILSARFPAMYLGSYKVNFKYVIPGNQQGTNKKITYKNKI